MYALNLDGSSWQELYRHACDRMAQLVPGWSDEIPSDPAVAALKQSEAYQKVAYLIEGIAVDFHHMPQ